jgi:hypothetical protein
MGKLLTYSEATLEYLLLHIRYLAANGAFLVEIILVNETRYYGYASLVKAEEMAQRDDPALPVNPKGGGTHA